MSNSLTEEILLERNHKLMGTIYTLLSELDLGRIESEKYKNQNTLLTDSINSLKSDIKDMEAEIIRKQKIIRKLYFEKEMISERCQCSKEKEKEKEKKKNDSFSREGIEKENKGELTNSIDSNSYSDFQHTQHDFKFENEIETKSLLLFSDFPQISEEGATVRFI